MSKKIDAASPWNPSACLRLERCAEAIEVVLSNLEGEIRERKDLEGTIADLTLKALTAQGAEVDKIASRIKDAKAEHFDVVQAISLFRAKRGTYLDEVLRVIKGARQGQLFDANEPLPEPADKPEPKAEEPKADDADQQTIDPRPVGRPEREEPPALNPSFAVLVTKFPGRYRLLPAVKNGRTAEIVAGDFTNLVAQVESIVGLPHTFDGTYGRITRDDKLLCTVEFVCDVKLEQPQEPAVDQDAPAKKKTRTKKAAAK